MMLTPQKRDEAEEMKHKRINKKEKKEKNKMAAY